jgi:hypothetical protein
LKGESGVKLRDSQGRLEKQREKIWGIVGGDLSVSRRSFEG